MIISNLIDIEFDKSKGLIGINDTNGDNKPGFYFRTLVKQISRLNFQSVSDYKQLLFLIAVKKFKTKIIKGQIISKTLSWNSDTIDRKKPSSTVYFKASIEEIQTFQILILLRQFSLYL